MNLSSEAEALNIDFDLDLPVEHEGVSIIVEIEGTGITLDEFTTSGNLDMFPGDEYTVKIGVAVDELCSPEVYNFVLTIN